MYSETSNLLTYSPTQISLLIDAVNMKIKDEQMNLRIRHELACGDDLSDIQVQINNEAITKCNRSLEDLYGLRVALLNAWTSVRKMQQIECN